MTSLNFVTDVHIFDRLSCPKRTTNAFGIYNPYMKRVADLSATWEYCVAYIYIYCPRRCGVRTVEERVEAPRPACKVMR